MADPVMPDRFSGCRERGITSWCWSNLPRNRAQKSFFFNEMKSALWLKRTVLTKSTHAMKRASHVGCNACNARIQRVLHHICYSNVAHMKRASSVQHSRNA
jgi:hypothetical protein